MSETPRDEPKGPPQYKYEVKAGDMADLFATNKHKYVPLLYKDFARRVVLKYPVNKVCRMVVGNVLYLPRSMSR